MTDIKGRYNEAKVFADDPEPSAIRQIQALCDQPFSAGSSIRIMPDVHVGRGCRRAQQQR